MTLPRETVERIKNIHLDNISGSVEITRKGALTIRNFVQRTRQSTRSEFRRKLHRVLAALVHAQPMMAGVANLADAVNSAADRADENDVAQSVLVAAEDFVRRLDLASELVAHNAARLIRSGSTVFTHSFSSAVYHALLHARKEAKRFKVFCTESRPMCEGVALARKLGRAGIATTVITDAAVFSFLEEASSVIVGADAVSARGIVNKVGTCAIARAAKTARVPFFVLCDSTKFVSPPWFSETATLNNPEEIIGRHAGHNVTARNPYFDSTQFKFISKIVTEKGVFTPGEIRRSLKSSRQRWLLRTFS